MAGPQVVVPKFDNTSLVDLEKAPLDLDSTTRIDEDYEEDKEDREDDNSLNNEQDEVGEDNEQVDMDEDND